MSPLVRTRLAAVAGGAAVLLAVGCSSTPTITELSSESTTTTAKVTTTTAAPTTTEKVGTTTTEKAAGTTTTKKATTTTVKKTPAEWAVGAIDAFTKKLGDVKAMKITVNFNSGDNNRAEAMIQDPAKPANVDAYEYTGGELDGPTPVKLTGDGALEDNLFPMASVAWDKLPAMFDEAVLEIGELEGSKGVTHFIVQKNLPFDSDTVVRVYVDGGTRTSGGSVAFLPDGTVKQVYAPS